MVRAFLDPLAVRIALRTAAVWATDIEAGLEAFACEDTRGRASALREAATLDAIAPVSTRSERPALVPGVALSTRSSCWERQSSQVPNATSKGSVIDFPQILHFTAVPPPPLRKSRSAAALGAPGGGAPNSKPGGSKGDGGATRGKSGSGVLPATDAGGGAAGAGGGGAMSSKSNGLWVLAAEGGAAATGGRYGSAAGAGGLAGGDAKLKSNGVPDDGAGCGSVFGAAPVGRSNMNGDARGTAAGLAAAGASSPFFTVWR
jgi:hypothetical protein